MKHCIKTTEKAQPTDNSCTLLLLLLAFLSVSFPFPVSCTFFDSQSKKEEGEYLT